MRGAGCQAMEVEDICGIVQDLLYAVPMQQLNIYMPRWIGALDAQHPVKSMLYSALREQTANIHALSQAETALSQLSQLEQVVGASVTSVDLGTGTVCCTLTFPEALFYEILSEQTGMEIENDAQLMEQLAKLCAAKQEYDKIADALSSVKATGYGVVMPTAEEMSLQEPEVLRKGNAYGIRLKAAAPSIHMIRVDVDTEISPMVGDEKQSKDLVAYLTGESPEKLWQSNIFGKSVYALVQEGLTAKLLRTPEDVRSKFRGSLNRIVNEGAAGLICLIL